MNDKGRGGEGKLTRLPLSSSPSLHRCHSPAPPKSAVCMRCSSKNHCAGAQSSCCSSRAHLPSSCQSEAYVLHERLEHSEVSPGTWLPSLPMDTFPLVMSRLMHLHHGKLNVRGETLRKKQRMVPKQCQHTPRCKRGHMGIMGCPQPLADPELWPLCRTVPPLQPHSFGDSCLQSKSR